MIKKQFSFTLFILLILVSFNIWVGSFTKIHVLDGIKEYEYWTSKEFVKDVIEDLNLNIGKDDTVYPALNSSLAEVNEIQIRRGKNVKIIADNKALEKNTPADTVEEFLDINNFSLGAKDIIEPALAAKITAGMEIKITRVTEKREVVIEEIPFQREYKNDNNLLRGINKVIQKGTVGNLEKTFLVKFHDGIEYEKKLIKEVTVNQPINEIVAQGTKQVVQRSGKNLDFKKAITMSATAYTHTGSRTYTGVWPKRGTAAVDPKAIPIGSKLYIEGYGYAVAQDIGNSIKGNKIDLFVETKSEALRWGRKTVRVFLLN